MGVKIAPTRYLLPVDVSDGGSFGRRKTRVVEVRSVSSGELLGTIKWWPAWRQYTFHPEPGTLFNGTCLQDIELWMASLMDERR